MAKTEEKKKWFLKSKGIWITAGAIMLAAVITAIATILVPYIESKISKEGPSPNSPPLQVEVELKAIDSYRGLEKEGDKLALMEGA